MCLESKVAQQLSTNEHFLQLFFFLGNVETVLVCFCFYKKGLLLKSLSYSFSVKEQKHNVCVPQFALSAITSYVGITFS